jgi:hypothetical protein
MDAKKSHLISRNPLLQRLNQRVLSTGIQMKPWRQNTSRISHRFGTLNSGYKELWGLTKPASELRIRNWLDRLMVGVGQSSYLKEYVIICQIQAAGWQKTGRILFL